MSRRSFVVLLATLAAALALQSWAHLWEVLHRSRIDTALDLDRSNGLPDVLSTIVVVMAAGGAAVLGSRRQGRSRQLGAALAGALALVALEDALHFHPGFTPIGDLLTGINAVAVFVLLLRIMLVETDAGGRAKTTLALGLLALVGSLVIGELPELYQWFERARGDPIIERQIVIKQGLELAGWWLVAMALWDVSLRQSAPPAMNVSNGCRESI